MSHLRLYDPASAACDSETDFPATLPLRGSLVSAALAVDSSVEAPAPVDRCATTMLSRARMLRANSTCPHCRRSSVLPLLLNDATVGRDNLPIPGTGSLVGFRCDHCRCEWPASDPRNQ